MNTLRLLGALATGAAASVATAIPAHASIRPPAPAVVDAEDAEQQAAVLAAEDRRLIEVRTVTSLARWQGKNWKTPYRLGTTSGYTLVLTPRSEPYTVDDLLELAPQTFLRMSDGSFLLQEHIVVTPRATLRLSAPGGLNLRLASGPDGFSTIVSLGGRVEIVGEEQAEVTISSWDQAVALTDDITSDGRAYVRAVGGQFDAQYVRASHLGFWSGRTGGISLTGTDRPNTGAIESGGGDLGAPSLLEDLSWQPAGPITGGGAARDLDVAVPAVDYVSSRMSHVTVEHDAFGLFVSGANGVQVTDSSFTDNLFGGVVLHRYVTNGIITRTTSSHNAGDGFAVDRATSGIAVTESTAIANAGSGLRLAGRPLADGPSPVGASLRSYGNNSVSGNLVRDNGRYGIELKGGINLGVANNVIEGHDMGIMVSGPADRVAITGNTVRNSDRHGIALVDGVVGATVTGNVVAEASTGVYLRDSVGEIKGNTVHDAGSHGVSLVGNVGGTEVSFNVLAGSGASALDTHRSHGDVTRDTNNVAGWDDTTPWYHWFEKLLQPMAALWSVLAVLIGLSAVRSRRKNGVIVHPYAHQMAHQGFMSLPVGVVDLTDARTLAAE